MAEWTEKCLTCAKSGSIPKWGWSFACTDEKCEYTPRDAVEATTITVSAYTQPACINCSNNPKNGGSGICGCTLGLFEVT